MAVGTIDLDVGSANEWKARLTQVNEMLADVLEQIKLCSADLDQGDSIASAITTLVANLSASFQAVVSAFADVVEKIDSLLDLVSQAIDDTVDAIVRFAGTIANI